MIFSYSRKLGLIMALIMEWSNQFTMIIHYSDSIEIQINVLGEFLYILDLTYILRKFKWIIFQFWITRYYISKLYINCCKQTAINDTSSLCKYLQKVRFIHTILIYGAFNIDWSNGTWTNTIAKMFYDFTKKYALKQIVTFYTRDSNIIDIIITNNGHILSSIFPTNPIKYNKRSSDHLSFCSLLISILFITQIILLYPIMQNLTFQLLSWT